MGSHVNFYVQTYRCVSKTVCIHGDFETNVPNLSEKQRKYILGKSMKLCAIEDLLTVGELVGSRVNGESDVSVFVLVSMCVQASPVSHYSLDHCTVQDRAGLISQVN
jgi:hypothetical protein